MSPSEIVWQDPVSAVTCCSVIPFEIWLYRSNVSPAPAEALALEDALVDVAGVVADVDDADGVGVVVVVVAVHAEIPATAPHVAATTAHRRRSPAERRSLMIAPARGTPIPDVARIMAEGSPPSNRGRDAFAHGALECSGSPVSSRVLRAERTPIQPAPATPEAVRGAPSSRS